MNAAADSAQEALTATVSLLRDSGLLPAIRALQQDVWAANLDRHEPDELGDTARSLGLLTFENFAVRAVRRFSHDDLEPADTHWDIEGLKVGMPNGVLTFELDGACILCKKLPPAEGRAPRWDKLTDWDNESDTRLEFARENSKVLGGYTTPNSGQGELGDFRLGFGRTPGIVRNFLYVWAGESDSRLTSGWLTVPTLGVRPFAAVAPLWRDTDDQPFRYTRTKKRGPEGPNFDHKPPAEPAIALKPRPAIEGEQ